MQQYTDIKKQKIQTTPVRVVWIQFNYYKENSCYLDTNNVFIKVKYTTKHN